MKVLLCAPYKGVVGGISRWTRHIVNYYNEVASLSEVKLEVLPLNRQKGGYEEKSKLRRAIAGFNDYKPLLKDYKARLSNGEIDIVHITSSASLSLMKDLMMLRIAKKKKVKSVIHFRFGRIPDIFQHKNWEQTLLDKVLRMADKVIVIDLSSYKTLIDCNYTNIELLPNPLTPEINKIIDENSSIVKEERKILFAGHMISSKGVFELVEACKDIENINLTMIGHVTSEMKSKLEQLAGSPKWLNIKGELEYQETIYEMLSARIFALPTYTEGFPNVILESMACGCSIVASSVGAIPEMLNIEGEKKCGICVEAQNIEELKDSLNYMLNNTDFALECGLNAKERVKAEYSMPTVWNQMCNIWKSLLN